MAIMVNFFSKKVLQHFKFPGNTTVEMCKIHFHLNAPINNASIFIKNTAGVLVRTNREVSHS